MRTGWAVAGALTAMLAGACGGDDGATGDEAGPAAPAGGDAYEGELEDGSTLRITLDVDPQDPAVAPFESFRSSTGGPAVTWIVGEITVPDGVDGTGRFVTFVGEGLDPLDDEPTDDGDGITNAEFACSLLDEWAAASTDEAVADAHLELYEGACGGQTLQVLAPGGETTTYVLAHEGELPAFERLMAGLATELEPA
jgi:hypothetical protein